MNSDARPTAHAPVKRRPQSDLLTSTEAAQRMGVRVSELDALPLHPVEGPTGTRRYTVGELDRVLHPAEQLTIRDRRHLAVVCGGGAGVLAALIAWVIAR